ncbi:MAG TPA: hypothetical protein VKZ44_09425 [Taishania sp.]|nr:hypothetical protein [Taishania sp.]
MRRPIYISTLITILYFISKWVKYQSGISNKFIDNYFTDLLFIPLQLSICLIGVRLLKQDRSLIIPTSLIITLFALMSILFELITPTTQTKYAHTGDWMDVLMYLIGSLGFYLIQRFYYREKPLNSAIIHCL